MTLRASFSIYARRDVAIVALLGFSAGLPLALTGATLAVWLADVGVDLATIGLLSLVGLPYTLKFIWAPLVDAVAIPGLTAWLGRRRAWLVVSQIALLAATLFLATRDPLAAPWVIGFGALLVATASATLDIVIDAYRVESLPPEVQAAGMASYVAAYRIAMLVSGAGVLALAALLDAQGWAKGAAWAVGYTLAALLGVVGLMASFVAREPVVAGGGAAGGNGLAGAVATARGAFADFHMRRGAIALLLLVATFKLCDALAGAMTGPFVLARGYDKLTYAGIVKGVGLAATLAGGFLGGLLAARLTMLRALWLAALLQMLSNLAFVWLAVIAPSTAALAAAIVIENAAGGIATVIFVAFLSALCQTPAHTATQYALLTALASLGRTLFGALSGYAADALGWPLFYLATMLVALPSLLLLAWLAARGALGSLEAPQAGTLRT